MYHQFTTNTATSFLHVLSWFCTFHMQMLHFPMIESTHLYPLPIPSPLLLLIRSICSIPDWNAHVHVICCGHLNLAWYGLLLSRLGTTLKKQSAPQIISIRYTHNLKKIDSLGSARARKKYWPKYGDKIFHFPYSEFRFLRGS